MDTEPAVGASLLLPDDQEDDEDDGGVDGDDGDDDGLNDGGGDGDGDVSPRRRIPASRCRPVLARCLLGQTATTLENNYDYNCYMIIVIYNIIIKSMLGQTATTLGEFSIYIQFTSRVFENENVV